MTVRVKICGLKTAATLDAALDAGADFVGLVRYARSPRHVSLAQAAELVARAADRALAVVLTVDPSDLEIDEIMATVNPQLIQLHGAETPGRVSEIAAHWGVRTIKAVKIETAADVAAARVYFTVADIVLFDAKPPKTATALPGGNGLAFDWQLLSGIKDRYMLSGGLTPDTVADAVALTGAAMVDVSSGVERAPGDKDPELIRTFIERAKAAAGTRPDAVATDRSETNGKADGHP